MSELFIGMTTWNDAEFTKRSVAALRRTLEGVDYTLAAWDNASTDDTVRVLKDLDVPYVVKRCAQGDALNGLLAMSRARHTLLLHSDVFLLTPGWYGLLAGVMAETGVALISPEDIGCGNMRRVRFRGNPESSFMFFDTDKANRCKSFLPIPMRQVKDLAKYRYIHSLRRFNFDADHITHAMAALLVTCGFTWLRMTPLASRKFDAPWFDVKGYEEVSSYEYGDGNFYCFNGVITHYHNWFARYIGQYETGGSSDLTEEYRFRYTRRFFADFDAGTLHLPDLPPC